MESYTCKKCGKKLPWEYESCPYCKTPRPEQKEHHGLSLKTQKIILASIAIMVVSIGIILVISPFIFLTGDKSEITYDVDWDQCLVDLKESVLDQEFYPYAKDVYAGVDEEEKQISFTAVLDDSTEPSVALDYADTIIRQYNLIANMQDNRIALGGKDYYGGLYDQYSIMIGIASLSKTENNKEWFVFDAVMAGTHQAIDLQKTYK